MTTHLVWFSYSLDAAPLLQAVRCAVSTFPQGSKFHVFDQHSAPLDKATVEALQALGVRYSVTTFERNGNLNGASSVVGEIECFRSTGTEEGDLIWKSDCDTLILRPDVMLKRFHADPNLLGAGLEMPGSAFGWWGPSYAYRRAVLGPMLDHFLTYGCPTPNFPEDVAMSVWLQAQNPRRCSTLTTSKTGGSYSWYNWHTQLSLAEYAARFDIITFGNRAQMPSFSAVGMRLRQAAFMELMLDGYLGNSGETAL